MVINRRIKRVLLENKAQYIGSIVLIVFSCLVFTLMSQFAGNFARLTHDFTDRYVQEDAAFITEQRISHPHDLESAANAIIEEGFTFDYKSPEGKTLRIFSQNERVNIPAILSGRSLGGRGEILLSPTFAAANHYKIGDVVMIENRAFTVVGFMALPNYIYPLQAETDMMPPPSFGVAVVSRDDFEAFGKGSSFYAVKFNQTAQDPRTQAAQFKDLLKSRGINLLQWTDSEDNKRVSVVTAEGDILNLVSKVLPTGILLLATIMVGNIIGRMIHREATIIGALYALGYRRRELTRHYMTFPLAIALGGGFIGTILGMFPVRAMLSFMLTAFPMPLTGIVFDPLSMLIGLLLPVLFLGASGAVVIGKELRHAPVELMKGKQDQHQANLLERTLQLDKLRFAAKFRIREQSRSPSRLAFLLAGIAVATMLLQWGFCLKSAFDYLVSEGSVASIYPFKYEYKFDHLRYEPLPAGAEPFSASLFLPAHDSKRDFYITGVPAGSALVTLVDQSGARLSMNQVIATKSVADLLKIKEGDTVNVIRKQDGRAFPVQVDRIAATYAGNFIFMPLTDYNERLAMPAGSYSGAFSNVQLDIPADQSYSVVTLEDKIAGVKEAMAPMRSMIGALATMAFIIGVIVIYVVTSLVVEENRPTISLMKIFGYRQREINSLILNSSTVVVVIGYIIGLPLTLAAVGVLAQSIENSVGMTLPPMRIDWPYLVIGFVVVLLSYELSKLLCRKKVTAVPMSEALKAGTE